MRGGQCGKGNRPGMRQKLQRPWRFPAVQAALAGRQAGPGPGEAKPRGSAAEPSQPRPVPRGPSGRARKRQRDKQDVTPRPQQGHREQEAGATALLSHLVSLLWWTSLNRQGGRRGGGDKLEAGKHRSTSKLF